MRALIGTGLLLATLPLSAAELRDVRVWAGPESTRVVFDLDDETGYTLSTLKNPERVVIDLPKVRRAGALKLPEGAGLLRGLRSGNQRDGLRMVIDLKDAATPRSFVLAPNAEYGYRLVVDLFGSAPAAGEAATPAPTADPQEEGSIVAVTPPQLELTERISPASATPAAKTAPAAPRPEPRTPKTAPPAVAEARPAPKSETKAPPQNDPKPAAPQSAEPIVIAVDAGHGGEDPGARGKSGVLEKEVALAMARRLAVRINAEPGYKAVLTRDGDYYVSLRQRMAKARRAQADLFVSVHANSNHDRRVHGTAVYVLSDRGASSEHGRVLAERENASDLIGGVDIQDKDDTLAAVLVDISQASAMEASQDAAGRVLASLGKINRLLKPDVQQAAFVVLKAPDMPSMLVETAFISNEKEERHLNDPEYQERIAGSILEGIKGYFDSYRPTSQQMASRAALAAP